ncbi:MAG: adenylate/guanylate cyclase domain-containing response regulator [Alphaproteobacteria bacterium]|nr:MAG: adenylate/guanylate cyclase domain-containing response regulator [Alphaproteobacteria bacterium]
MPCPATMRRRWKRDATAISPNRSARASFSPKCANSWGDAEGSRRLRTPPRILVADDNPTNLEVLRVRLNAHGYEVVTAVDGEDALRRARELEPDLVLLDIMMPRMDGWAAREALATRDIVGGLEAGADDYLAKPFEQAALVARVRSMLRIKELHDTVQRQAAQLKEQTEQLSSWNRSLEERVTKQVAEIERVNRLRRFLAPQVAQMIASSDAPDALLASHRREVTVLFCDLRGFTAFTEASEPEEVTAVLREYHECMGELIFRYEGTLERFLGDGIMIVFNDPLPCPDHTERAVRLALDMRGKVEELAKEWARKGHLLGFGIGIASGYATIGQVGFEHRREYTANGSVINLASRLCDEAKPGQIVISRRAFAAVEQWVGASHIGQLSLKGFTRPIDAYEVVSWQRASGPS